MCENTIKSTSLPSAAHSPVQQYAVCAEDPEFLSSSEGKITNNTFCTIKHAVYKFSYQHRTCNHEVGFSVGSLSL